jgi:glycosyltransferase involved in cell wall biosynthesis
MRILLVNDYAPGPGGGAEVHVGRLADALRAAGHEVELFAGVVRHEGLGRALDAWDPRARSMLRSAAGRFRPDVVHYHNIARELSPSVLGAVQRTARVLTVHDPRLLGRPEGPTGEPVDAFVPRILKLGSAAALRALVLRHVHTAIALTEAMAGRLRDAGFRDVEVVPNFAPPGPAAETPPSASGDVLYAGYLSTRKGCANLIEAFSRVAAGRPGSTLVFAGDGPDRARLEAIAADRAPGRVRFLGTLGETEVRELMGRVRLLVLPSLGGDVSPNVLIEASFVARPVVITDHSGVRELVDQAGNGSVVRPGDVEELAAAIDRLLADGKLADELGASGREAALVRRTPEVAAANHTRVYEHARELLRSS